MSLEPNQVTAARLLAKGETQTQTASAVGVSRRTIVRWLSLPEFKNLCFGLSAEAPAPVAKSHLVDPESPVRVRSQPNNLTAEDLVPNALQAVQDILTDPDARTSGRLKAASLAAEWAGLSIRGRIHELQAFQVLRDLGFLQKESVELVEIAYSECQQKIKQAMRVEDKPKDVYEDDSWLQELEEEE